MTKEERQRIETAVTCRDCDYLPKHKDAGKVFENAEGDFQLMHNGIRTYTDTHYGSFNIEIIRRLKGHHEPQEEVVFYHVLKHIQNNGIIMELGSFWAYYSLWFLNENSKRKAILVEPLEDALEAGQRNFWLNKKTGKFVKAAIGDTVNSDASIELWPGKTVVVNRTTVDELIGVLKLDRINMLHSDIQGAEVSMLRGAGNALRDRKIDWVFISTHGENIHQKCLQILRRFGYFIHAAHTPAESFTVDGLIVAGLNRERLPVKISKRRSWGSEKARWRAKIRVQLLERIGLKPITC